MQIQKIFLAVAVLLFISISPIFVPVAHAMTPVLSLSTSGQTGDYVQANVTGDPSAPVFLFSGSYAFFLGNIPSSGYGSFSVGSSQSENQNVSIASNSSVYVKTGGINGTSSATTIWPYVQNSTTSTLTLSQGALLLNAGQSSTVTASASYLYLFSNSSPTVANVNFNASQITVQALTYGSTVANICIVGSTSNCATLTITVQNSSAQQLNFSQNNFSIVSGQSTPVSITGGSGSYVISNNSNSSSIQTNLSGSVVTLTATSTTGSASITVCTADMNYCGIINVNSTASNSTAVTFSQTNPVVAIGQSTTVTIYGGTGNNFYVSSNSNPSIVQPNINNNILTLIGNTATGTSAITICAVSGTCSSLTANVSSTASTGGSISLSQTTVTILAGQSSNITISGGSAPYSISSPSVANIFNGVVNGNILTVYGVGAGSANVSVCSSVGCTTLYVTVNSTTSTINSLTFSQNNILLNVGQQSTVYVTGTGSYYISNNSNSNVASEQISGSSITISALAAGSANVSICQNGGQCETLYVTVSGTTNSTSTSQLILSQNSLSLTPGQNMTVYATGTGNYYISNNPTPSVASAQISGNSVAVSAIGYGTDNISICQNDNQCVSLSISVLNSTAQTGATTVTSYIFPRYLGYGDKGDDVLQLQKLLSTEGYLSATPNGHYGPATVVAVKKFQKANKMSQTGNVGPATKAALNKLSASSVATDTTGTTKDQQVSAVQEAIQKLQAQLSAISGQ